MRSVKLKEAKMHEYVYEHLLNMTAYIAELQREEVYIEGVLEEINEALWQRIEAAEIEF